MPKKVGETDGIRIYYSMEKGYWTIEPPNDVVREWAEYRGVNTSGTGRWNILQTKDILLVAQSIKDITKLIKRHRKKKKVVNDN